MKKIISVIMAVMITFSLSTEIFAISYTNQFIEYYTAAGTATARSPFHYNNENFGGDDFTLPSHRVNGPNNQPRLLSDGTIDVHNGTDYRAVEYTNVYPMFPAKVIDFKQPGTVNDGYVILQYDIDLNESWDNYYVKYLHIVPESNFVKGQTVLGTYQKVGVIDIKRGNGWDPHLHLQDTNSTGSTSIKLFRYFRNVQNWGYGYYLDYFAGDVISTNSLYISVNSMDEGTNAPPTRVEFYYKRGSGVWTQGPNMNLYQTGDSTGNYWRYWLDLKSATGASSGETIYFYLAAIRGNPPVSTSYNWGLWPQYYKMPEKLPAEIIADGKSPIVRVHYVQ